MFTTLYWIYEFSNPTKFYFRISLYKRKYCMNFLYTRTMFIEVHAFSMNIDVVAVGCSILTTVRLKIVNDDCCVDCLASDR